MTVETDKQTLGFQTEVKQLLQLMIHSLYSNKEIFLRELISNAADAVDKLRFQAIAAPDLLVGDPNLRIRIDFDPSSHTIVIDDNGIGMSREEAVAHLGTIAKSGTSEFLQSLTGDQQKDSNLIGQFGVGFYSAFIVAKQVEVVSRRADLSASEAVSWSSLGDGDFAVSTIDKPERGTRVILHLKDDEHDFANSWRLRNLVRKYSDHISIPIEMRKEEPAASDDDQSKQAQPPVTWETINQANALWTRPKSQITDEQYHEFYKHIAHDANHPIAWSHHKVEGKLEYTSLLYVPARPPFDLYHRDSAKGLKLYVQRVFIMDQADQFLPLYLRFIKGVVDSADLPLNVSREILQSGAVIDSMKSALTKRALDMLDKIAKNQPDDYATVWRNFGQVLKEGPAEDYSNRERVAGLLRFASTHTKNDAQTTSLAQYIERMPADQDKIYYLTGESYAQLKDSPHLEIFAQKDIEVLLLFDRIDEWLMSYLTEFDGKSLVDIARGELDLGKLSSKEDDAEHESSAQAKQALASRMQTVLGDRVAQVRVSHRLTQSPAILALADGDLGLQMRQLLEASGQTVTPNKPILEFNPKHPLLTQLDAEPDTDRFADLCHVLFDQAALAAGTTLQDPAGFVRRLNKLLLDRSSTSHSD